jgi:hypothetical protein
MNKLDYGKKYMTMNFNPRIYLNDCDKKQKNIIK